MNEELEVLIIYQLKVINKCTFSFLNYSFIGCDNTRINKNMI